MAVVVPVVVVAMTVTVVVVVVAMTVAVAVVAMTVAVPIVTVVYPFNGSGLARRIPDLASCAAHRPSLHGHRRDAQREGSRCGDKPVLGCHSFVPHLFGVARNVPAIITTAADPTPVDPAWLMANAW
jgi:hypothetical protein